MIESSGVGLHWLGSNGLSGKVFAEFCIGLQCLGIDASLMVYIYIVVSPNQVKDELLLPLIARSLLPSVIAAAFALPSPKGALASCL